MVDIKQMSFVLLVLLVSVSGIYEWTQTDDVLRTELGVGVIGGFSSGTLQDDVNQLQVSSDNLITTVARVELWNWLGALQSFLGTIWDIFMKLMFGWMRIVSAIFDAVGLENLDIVFIAPLAVLQALGALYFLRDIVNTVRGVG